MLATKNHFIHGRTKTLLRCGIQVRFFWRIHQKMDIACNNENGLDISHFDFTPGNVVLVVASQWSARVRRDLLRDIDSAIDAHTAWAFGDHPLFHSPDSAQALSKSGLCPFRSLHVWKHYERDALLELIAYQIDLMGNHQNGQDSHSAVLYVDLAGVRCLPLELAELVELTSKALRITVVLLADAPFYVSDLTEGQRRNIDTVFYMDAPLYTDEVYKAWFAKHFNSVQMFRAHEVLALQHGFVFTMLA